MKVEWKRTAMATWTAYYKGQRLNIAPYRQGNGKLCYVPRLNTLSPTSTATAYARLAEAKKVAKEFVDINY